MYTVSVPLFPAKADYREKILSMLKEAKVQRVFLCSERYFDKKEYAENLSLLKENIAFFRDNGFEIGVWIGETVGHWCHPDYDTDCGLGLRPWTDIFGKTFNGNYCPADEKFLSYVDNWISDIAKAKPDIILLDDDFRMSMHASKNGCLCAYHRQAFCQAVGEELTREEIRRKVFLGKPNRYRQAWLEVQGNTLQNAAKHLRQTLDKINPAIRLGLCAVLSTWDMDGVDALTLSKILAGNTKPLLRLNGAPYWASGMNKPLSEIIELQRQQLYWCRDSDCEIMLEGDTYPRPRFNCPALRLELFDMATRAACTADGILKYMLDYYASPDYETGYLERHIRNLPDYDSIMAHFSGKREAGIRVITPLHRVTLADHPTVPDDQIGWDCWDWFTDPAVVLLTDCSMPLSFSDGDGLTAAFDTAVEELTEKQLQNGVILDIKGARRLLEKGVDIGMTEAVFVGDPTNEYFPAYDETVALPYGARLYRPELKDGAEVLSEFSVNQSRIPGVFRYRNDKGQKFLVLPFEISHSSLTRNYCRQRQIAETAVRFGHPLPALAENNPELYLLVKEDDTTLTVGLFNFFCDDIICPFVRLGTPFTEVDSTVRCQARKEQDGIRLLTDIPPMGFAVITVKKQ